MHRWTGLALAGLLAIGAGAVWFVHAGAGAEPASLSPPIAAAAASAGVEVSTRSSPSSKPGIPAAPEAPSWKGTVVDGDIHLDARGNLVPDRALRYLFDYLLTARGELSMDQIRQRLRAVGQAHALNTAQAAQLTSAFDRYLDYLQALPQVPLAGTDADGLRRTYEARRALRRGTLGIEMAEGFFADEEARDRYEIDSVAIRQDKSLTPQARAKALADLQGEAPPALHEVIQRSATVTDLAAETERLRASGANDAAIQALREREVGSDAAQRLAALDAERAQWQQRLADFRTARDGILGNPAYAPEDRQRQVDALMAQRFSDEESARVRALLALDAAPGPH